MLKILSNLKICQDIYFKSNFTFKPSQLFSNQSKKIDILKTYLQIIPPYQIHQLIEEKQNNLDNLLKKTQSHIKQLQGQNITTQQQQSQNQQNSIIICDNQEYRKDFKQIYKFIKKKSQYVPIETLSRVLEVINLKDKYSTTDIELYQYKRKIQLKILKQFQHKTEALPLQDVVNFIYRLAKMNKKQYQVMKAAQNVIIQQKIKINYPMIRKILWSFTHLDVGSPVLYTHISKTIKVGQYELEPLEIAEAAYMLSKVSQNAKGGFGIFEIAQRHIQANLSRMKFDELVKASSFMLTQNIGTNDFQLKLETQIFKKYPSKDQLRISDFVTLLKSTSAYYFKFNDKALFNLLRSSTVRQSPNTTLQQFQDFIWSWGRIGKGDQQLWQSLQTQVKKRIRFLKPRQLAFFYHSICSSPHANTQILQLLEKNFMKIQLSEVHEHYLIKFLLGMQKRKTYNKQFFLRISLTLIKKIQKLSKNELIAFLKVLNQSDYDYTNKQSVQSIITALDQQGSKKLQNKLYLLKITQTTQLLYLYIKFDIKNSVLIDQCFRSLSEVINIPKKSFAKALFCFTIKDNYEKAYRMVIILQELLVYGPIGYFFSPYEFPLIAYSVLHLYYRSKGSLKINEDLINQVQKFLQQMNPIILNDFVKKAYDQGIKIIQENTNPTKKDSEHKK